MKKRLLGFLLGAMLASMCVGCGAESTTTEQTKAATTTTTEESTPEQTVEETIAPEETEEPTSEAPEEPSEEVAPETETEEATQTETAEPVPTEEPTPEPQAEYTYTDMTATMYATQTVNVRNLPSTDGEKIGSLSTNQEITVIGQCNETSWYMFDYNGQTAFVSNSYLSTEKVEVQQSTGGNSSGGNVPAGVPNPFTVERRVVHDMGVYRFVICSYYDYDAIYKLNPCGAQGDHLNTSEDLWVWYECDNYYDPGYRAFIDTYTCNCSDADHNGLYPERLGN